MNDHGPAYLDERYAASELVWSAGPNQFVADRLSGLTPATTPGRALDLATGEGRNAVWLAEQGWQVTAIDFSAVAVERGRGRRADIDWRVGDVVTAAYPDGLDLVLIAYLHLVHADMATVVRRAITALRPGGTFLMVAHDASNIADGVGGPQDPSVLCTADQVVGWMGPDAEVVEAGRVERRTDAGTAYDLVVRALRTA